MSSVARRKALGTPPNVLERAAFPGLVDGTLSAPAARSRHDRGERVLGVQRAGTSTRPAFQLRDASREPAAGGSTPASSASFPPETSCATTASTAPGPARPHVQGRWVRTRGTRRTTRLPAPAVRPNPTTAARSVDRLMCRRRTVGGLNDLPPPRVPARVMEQTAAPGRRNRLGEEERPGRARPS